jgi:hypothetical protein
MNLKTACKLEGFFRSYASFAFYWGYAPSR